VKEKADINLVDIMPVDRWVEVEKEVNRRSGFYPAAYDVRGTRVVDDKIKF
jgi:hypothetical protein